MAELSRHEVDLINQDRHEQADLMRERLERLGIQVRIAHYEGDSSFPTEYTLRYSFVYAVGPAFDLALAELVEKLLRYVPIERA